MDEGVGVATIFWSNSGEEVSSDASITGGVVRRLLQLLQLADEPLPQDPVLDPDVVLDLTVRQLQDSISCQQLRQNIFTQLLQM